MSRGINKVILIGNLGQNPEVSYTGEGKAICNLSLATSESWKDKNTGEQKESVEWHKLVCFGKLAEICKQYLQKGSKIYIEGKLKTEKWTDKATGQDRYATKIIFDQMQMLDGASKGDGSYKPPPPETSSAPANDFDDDIIPF